MTGFRWVGWEFMTTTRWRFLFGEGWGIHDDDKVAFFIWGRMGNS